MGMKEKKYMVGSANLYAIRNRNEARVIQAMRSIVEDLQDPAVSDDVIADAYACALNSLPARYVQVGTIVLRDPVLDSDIEQAVKASLDHVLRHPKE